MSIFSPAKHEKFIDFHAIYQHDMRNKSRALGSFVDVGQSAYNTYRVWSTSHKRAEKCFPLASRTHLAAEINFLANAARVRF